VLNPRPHILLVLDQEYTCELLAYLLIIRGAGFRVSCAYDLPSSQCALQTKTIDLAVIPAVLANVTGTSVAAYARFLSVPTLAISVSPVQNSRVRKGRICIPVPLSDLRDDTQLAVQQRDEIIARWRRLYKSPQPAEVGTDREGDQSRQTSEGMQPEPPDPGAAHIVAGDCKPAGKSG
jgi:hypothetical protein